MPSFGELYKGYTEKTEAMVAEVEALHAEMELLKRRYASLIQEVEANRSPDDLRVLSESVQHLCNINGVRISDKLDPQYDATEELVRLARGGVR